MVNAKRSTLDKILLVATVSAIAAFLFRESLDADTWWQVAIGKQIFLTWAVPSRDIFSLAGWGRGYHDSHWFFQLFIAAAHMVGGMTGVSLAASALWGAAFTALFRAIRLHADTSTACILLFITAIACSDRFTPRPDIVTCLMISIFYLRLQEGKICSWRHIGILGLLQVIWTNSHGLFVIGPFMLGCYLFASLVPCFKVQMPLRRVAVATAVVLVATLVSPFGFNSWEYAYLLATEAGAGAPGLFKSLAELSPTFGPAVRRLPDFWAYAVVLILTAASCIPLFRRGGISWPRLMIVAGMFAASITGRRNIPLFVLAAAPLLAENLSFFQGRWKPGHLAACLSAAGMLVASAFPVSGSYYRWLNYPVRFGLGASPTYFPSGLPGFLKKTGFKGQIYNSNSLGGFLLLNGYLPLIDGRWEVYDAKELENILFAPFDPADWNNIAAKYRISGVLLTHMAPETKPLLNILKNNNLWRLVYLDHSSSFWMRRDHESLPDPIDLNQPLTIDPLRARVEDFMMIGNFYRAMGLYGHAQKLLEQGLGVGGKREQILEALAGVQLESGLSLQAERTYKLLLDENPENLQALNEMAFFAFSRGEFSLAKIYLAKAISISPADADIKANFERVSRLSSK